MDLIKLFAAAAAVAATVTIGSPAIAANCTQTTSFNSLGPPDVEFFGNTFSRAQAFTDCYTFTLDQPADSFGGAIEINTILNKLNIDLLAVTLEGGNISAALVDTSPLSFSFGGLIAGSYILAVSGLVTSDPGLWTIPVGYAGLVATVASPVPGPIAGAGLPGLVMTLGGLLVWRRRNRAAAG